MVEVTVVGKNSGLKTLNPRIGTFIVEILGEEYEINIGPDGLARILGQNGVIDIRPCGRNTYSVLINGVSTQVIASGAGNNWQALLSNKLVDVRVETSRDRLLKKHLTASAGTHRRYEIHAPMPALVVRVEVAEGDRVKEGQGLLVLEAMKMENEIRSHQEGKVKELYVTKGKPVEKGELLMLLE